MFVLSLSGSGGRFLRCSHGTKSIKGDLITGILEIVWAVPAVCVRAQSSHQEWVIGVKKRGFLPPLYTLHLTALVFIVSVGVNNL